MEEEIEKLILAREVTRWEPEAIPYGPDQWSRVVDDYFIEFSRAESEIHLDYEAKLLFKGFYILLAKVDTIIDNADLTLCLTSKYSYIRERKGKHRK
jgi:hypothetical protein